MKSKLIDYIETLSDDVINELCKYLGITQDSPILPSVDKNRYFVVYYAVGTRTGSGYGYSAFNKTDGSYLREKETVKLIMDKNKKITSVTITGITELSKADYDSFNS